MEPAAIWNVPVIVTPRPVVPPAESCPIVMPPKRAFSVPGLALKMEMVVSALLQVTWLGVGLNEPPLPS